MMSISDRITEAPPGRLASEDPMPSYRVTKSPKMEPPHPGAILRDTVLPALGLSVTEAAADLGISRQMLHLILAEKKPITTEMALRIGKWAGNGAEIWHSLQGTYDLWHARKALAKDLARIPTRKERAAA